MHKLFLAVILAAVLAGGPSAPAAQTYYVDCQLGNDAGTGLAPESAWRSVARANDAALQPGDQLLFKRGCTWTLTRAGALLRATWSGTAEAPITLGAYGAGINPTFMLDAQGRVGFQQAILVTGSHLVLTDLRVEGRNPALAANCEAAPLGWYAGVTVSGDDNAMFNLEAAHLSLGIFLQDSADRNLVAGAYVHDLDVFWRLTLGQAGSAMGAIGVNLHGDDNEVRDSLFENNGVACTDTTGTAHQYSAPFEVYNANRAYVHHNTAYGHRKHFEVGKDAGEVSTGNVLAYNLFVSDRPNAKGPNVHGNDQFGPILDTTIEHNTIVLTGAGSEGLICGCAGGATVSHNIFVAERKAGFYNGLLVEAGNVYWDAGLATDPETDPLVQGLALGTGSVKADPQLDSGYRQTAGSPNPGAGALPYLPPTATATPTASPTATATATNTATPTATFTPTATDTPTATFTPSPTATPTLHHCSGWRGDSVVPIPCP